MQSDYQTHLDEIEHLVRMMQDSGQDDLIAEAVAEGETVESIAQNLVAVGWETDVATLTVAIERALADH